MKKFEDYIVTEKELLEQYDVAWQMLQDQRKKNDTLELELYNEFDKRLNDIETYMVDKIDEFLKQAVEECGGDWEKVAVVRSAQGVFNLAIEKEPDPAYEELRKENKRLSARNMRLAMDNNKLNNELKEKELNQKARQEGNNELEG